jgi:ribonuclease P protein component
MAMARLERLTRRAEFLKVAEGRRKFVAPGLILQAAAQPGNDALRVGFTASRKVGNSVARNRARRRLRAASAALLPDHASPGHDYVLIARGGTLTRGYPALLEDLAEGLRRLGLYRA